MNSGDDKSSEARGREQKMVQDKVNNWHGLLGLIALISLAIPALLVRSLFPELNPLIFAGLGVAVYSAYLGLMIVALARQAEPEQSMLETRRVATRKE